MLISSVNIKSGEMTGLQLNIVGDDIIVAKHPSLTWDEKDVKSYHERLRDIIT